MDLYRPPLCKKTGGEVDDPRPDFRKCLELTESCLWSLGDRLDVRLRVEVYFFVPKDGEKVFVIVCVVDSVSFKSFSFLIYVRFINERRNSSYYPFGVFSIFITIIKYSVSEAYETKINSTIIIIYMVIGQSVSDELCVYL